MTLAAAVDGERFAVDGLVGSTAGKGRPLLLVHSVNAAASVAEVRPLFDHYRRTRRVFAVDLPGFGLSDRSDRDYTPRLMTDALRATLAHIQQRCRSRAPVDALALSLGCEFLARAAAEQPALVGRLALVSPTGFRGTRPYRGAPGSTRGIGWLHRTLHSLPWSQALFDGLTRPAVVRYFLRRTFGSAQIDETMWAYAVQTARQPGARHAPLHFLAGNLFSADISDVYDRLQQPVWVCHGTRGDFTDYRGLQRLQDRPNWRVTVMDTGALPYAEKLPAFSAAFDDFLAAPAGGA